MNRMDLSYQFLVIFCLFHNASAFIFTPDLILSHQHGGRCDQQSKNSIDMRSTGDDADAFVKNPSLSSSLSSSLPSSSSSSKKNKATIDRREVLFQVMQKSTQTLTATTAIATVSTLVSSPLLALNANAYDDISILDVTPGISGKEELRTIEQIPKADLKRDNNRPFATNEALLPAVRVKLTLERASELTNQLLVIQQTATGMKEKSDSSSDTSASNSYDNSYYYPNLQTLQNLLLEPQNYTQSFQLQGVPQKPAKQYLEAYKPMNGDLPFQRYLIQNGDVNTWKNLKKKEKQYEKEDEVRAAFNAYTDVLSFSGDKYQLNVDSKTRSNMIRNDNLPELKQVVTSDMGMRYLYRNQILTSVDDVKAEFRYQLTLLVEDKYDELDFKELSRLLLEAQNSCDRWFSLIDPADVEAAILTVQNEIQST